MLLAEAFLMNGSWCCDCGDCGDCRGCGDCGCDSCVSYSRTSKKMMEAEAGAIAGWW